MGHVSLRALDHDIEQAAELRDQIAHLKDDLEVPRDHARRLKSWTGSAELQTALDALADAIDDVISDNIMRGEVADGALAVADKDLLEAESTYACHAYTATDRLSGCM